MNQPSIRVEGGVLTKKNSATGVGHYAQRLITSLREQSSVDVSYGPVFHSQSDDYLASMSRLHRLFLRLSFRTYRKLDSLNIRLPFDMFLGKVDATIFVGDFSSWKTSRSKVTATVIHDLAFLHYPERIERKNLKHLKRVVPRAIKESDFIITGSEFTKSELINQYAIAEDNVLVTPIPYEKAESILDRPVHETYDIPSGSYILFIGTVEPRKNVDILIRAYLQLDEEMRNSHALVIAGGIGWGNERFNDLLSSLSTSDRERIVLTGYFNEDDKDSLIANAAVLVLPSEYEGFGMQILEAMSIGTPVVCSDIPVFREVAGGAASYFRLPSVIELSENINRIVNSEQERNILIRKGADRTDSFSWNDNALKVLNEINERLRFK